MIESHVRRMWLRWLVLALASMLWCAGCRTPRQVAALREENRQLEERLYQIAELLADCRRENRRLREQLERQEETLDRKRSADGVFETAPRLPEESTLPREPGLPKIHVEGVPQPDQRSGELPPQGAGARRPAENFSTRPFQPSPVGLAHHVPAATGVVAAPAWDFQSLWENTRRLERIELNPSFTGGWDADGRPGDDGIQVLIEPRTATGQLIPAVGAVSLVVVDPALTGQEARVARWDIPVTEIGDAFTQTPFGEGIALWLPWPERVPVHSRLHLFVRLITVDGRKLERDMPIQVTLLPEVAGSQAQLRLNEPADGLAESWLRIETGFSRDHKPRTARQPPEWSPIR